MATKIETPIGNDNGNLPAVAALQEDMAPAGNAPAPAPDKPVPWGTFLQTANGQQVKERIARDISEILKKHGLQHSCCLALLEPVDSIDSFDLDRLYAALNELNPAHDKEIILFLLSRGGAGEPAYQISKICKSFTYGKFKVVVTREAKSAATLIAIGADEIHMGPLGQLGPIDPQIDGLPALGVSQALKTIASVSQQYPKSAEMFATYLRMALTVEQIGYCDRISESAVQYAERLLATKPSLSERAGIIAKELVHEYKDHSFVIDVTEAKSHLGAEWIITESAELRAGEEIYSLIKMLNIILAFKKQRLVIVGGAGLVSSVMLFETK